MKLDPDGIEAMEATAAGAVAWHMHIHPQVQTSVCPVQLATESKTKQDISIWNLKSHELDLLHLEFPDRGKQDTQS